MNNQFIAPIKTFLKLTRENLEWVANEIQHQYFLSTLRDIEKKYPEMHTEVEAFTEHLDAIFYGITDEDCPDFVEAPDDSANKFENGVVTTISNSIIVWDSGFSNTVYSVGVVLAKEGDSYRILDYIRDKLEIIGQLQEIRNFASKYPEAKVGIVPQANGAAILRLLQSEFPDIIEAKLALGDRTKVEQAIMERKLLTVPPSFNEFDEWKRIVNWGIGYLAIDSLTNVDLTYLKEGDGLTNRWGNDSAFETPEETEFFNSKIANDGLNEPDYPYDNETSA
jgi:hypothetical protein